MEKNRSSIHHLTLTSYPLAIPSASRSALTTDAVVGVVDFVRPAECASASARARQLAFKAASPLCAHGAPYAACSANASFFVNINAAIPVSILAPDSSANACASSDATATANAFALLCVARAAKR